MTGCQLCENSIAPYKCPTCRIQYCSVDCFKKHKTEICETSIVSNLVKTNSENIDTKYSYPTEDTVPMEKLTSLRDSEGVKNCLNNPHVRKIIQGILEAQNPTEAIAEAMVEPIFVELADACLSVVEPPDEV